MHFVDGDAIGTGDDALGIGKRLRTGVEIVECEPQHTLRRRRVRDKRALPGLPSAHDHGDRLGSEYGRQVAFGQPWEVVIWIVPCHGIYYPIAGDDLQVSLLERFTGSSSGSPPTACNASSID